MKTPRPRPSHRAAAGLAGFLVLAAVLAACGGTAAAPSVAPATAAPTTEPTASPTPASTPAPRLTATPAPYDFTSTAYGYRVTLLGASRTEPALQPWDGQSRIDSSGPYTDKVSLPDSILFFVYGAPTDLALDDYAARTQEQMVSWHQCPVTPDSATDLTLDGTPGRLHRMTCLGSYVQKLMVVRDGQGLVVNMIAPPGTEDEASKLFEDLIAAMTWPA